MTHRLQQLGRPALEGLAGALSSGRIVPPVAPSSLIPWIPEANCAPIAELLSSLTASGIAPAHIAWTLRLLAEERAAHQRSDDRVQLVWTPAEFDRVDARDTGSVVRELFRAAQTSILIASYALDDGPRAASLFGELAAKMDATPSLTVRIVANIHRKYEETTSETELIRAFSARMRTQLWPGKRLPEVYYDPRSLETDMRKRSVLHAKCVVADERWSFVTSANFTEAAQERNIELGTQIDDPRIASRITRQFNALIERGALALLK